MHTILDLLRWSSSLFNRSQIFYGHGTDNFWDESLHLILTSLNLPINIPTHIYNAYLTKKEKKLILKLINHRITKRIPVPYLTNTAWFCGLKFYVDKRVFIPRSPISELITSYFNNFLKYPPKYVLDMCTGSGCIAIAMATIYPNSEIDAVDISIDALNVAEYNVKLYNLEHKIFLMQSNLFDNLSKFKYDLILANPPYVKKKEINKLPTEFIHEPRLALLAKQNGLEIIHKIIKKSINCLNINGVLICEVGSAKHALIEHYPNTPFHWFNLNNGGDGIFALTYKELLSLNKNRN